MADETTTINTVPDSEPEATGYAEIDNLKNARTDILDENLFSLPQDRDFYINAVDTDWYTQVAGIKDESDAEAERKTKAAVFYTEDPPILDPGYYPDEYCYVVAPGDLKKFSTPDDVFMGTCDGDTVSFSLGACDTGDKATAEFLEQTSNQWQNKMLGFSGGPQDADFSSFVKKQSYDTIEIRILGIDCPEVPHLSVLSKQDYENSTFIASLTSQNNNFLTSASYVKNECTDNTPSDSRKWTFSTRNPGAKTRFIRIGSTYHEVLTKDEYFKIRGDEHSSTTFANQSVTPEYMYVSTDDTQPQLLAQGNAAARIMHTLINKSTDARVIIAANTQATKGDNSYPVQYVDTQLNDSGYWHQLKEFAYPFLGLSLFRHAGFNQVGQDLYGRILGALYLYGPYGGNGENIWINAAKYILTQTDQTAINKSINGSVSNGKLNNLLPDIIKPETYEYNTYLWADSLWENLEKYDDRHFVQAKVFDAHASQEGLYTSGDFALTRDLSSLAEWTVILGDIALMVPPTSIRCITQTTTERIPVVRARGTIAKGYEHSDRLIELHLYFNGEQGINGVPIIEDLPIAKSKQVSNPEDAKITYYMNGLRALISAFRLTPYLPIDNIYINTVLNVNAVCFQNISVSTVPNFPKLIQCVVTLREFDPSSFMPQLPISFGKMDYRNYFAKSINYATMRYYYQQPLILGNKLWKNAIDTNTPIDITSKEFMKETLFANRTAMIPCQFLKPLMDFYIADEDYLKELLKIKNEMSNKSAGGTFAARTEIQQRYVDDVTPLGKAIADLAVDKDLDKIFEGIGTEKASAAQAVEIQKYIIAYLQNKAPNIIYTIEKDSVTNVDKFTVTVTLNVPYITNDELLRTLRDQASNSLKVSMTDACKNGVFQLYVERDTDTNKLHLVTGGVAKKDNPFETGTTDPSFPDFKEAEGALFLGYCAVNQNNEANNTAMSIKQSIDVEDLESIHFETYLKNVRVDSIQVSFGNIMTSVALQNSDSVAPQYMGGTDCDIVVSITTTDLATAGLLDRLPKLASYLHRTYNRVLPMYPVKIDSEFTRMIGVNEVTFDNIIVNTVPNFPGTFTIQITMKSVDRTLRNREALRRVNVTNNSNEHITSTNDQSEDSAKTYFDLADTISQINLYPDLELPTISELSKAGFQFIRYKNRTMKYPDPDFYFIYPGVIFNEVVREVVRKYLEDLSAKDGNTTYNDQFGAQFTMGPSGTIDMSTANETWKNQLKYVKEVKSKKLAEERRRAEATAEALEAAMVTDLGSWDIGPKIKCVFMETYYFRQLKLYLNQIALGQFKHNTAADTAKEAALYEAEVAAEKKKAETENTNDNKTKTTEKTTTNEAAIPTKDTTDISYQATKGLHLYNRLGILRTVIANIDTCLSSSPKSDTLDYFDFEDISDRFIGVFGQETSFTGLAHEMTDDAREGSNYTAIGAGAGAIYGAASYALKGTVYTKDFNNLVVAALAAKAGRKECDTETITGGATTYSIKSALNNRTEMWLPDANVVGVMHGDGKQDSSGYKVVTKNMFQNNLGEADTFAIKDSDDTNTLLDQMDEVGIFRIKFYTLEEIQKMIAPDKLDKDKIETKNGDDPCTGRCYVLDPYYRYASKADMRKFKKELIQDPEFCFKIFMREMLFWLRKLYDTYTLPSISLDIHRKEATDESKILQELNEQLTAYNNKQGTDTTQLSLKKTTITETQKNVASAIATFLRESGNALDLGKIFAALALTITNGDQGLQQAMMTRDYKALNAYVKESAHTANSKDTKNSAKSIIRKFIMACIGTGAIAKPEEIGKSPALPSEDFVSQYNLRKVLAANNDPSTWLKDSFFDMIQSDFRGRMLRAFPTFYMILVDEGRDLGYWKLHDNFYNTNAITEIKIMKSRKNPADTCMITLSNIFNTFTDQDEDGKYNYNYGIKDVFNSIFSPEKYAEDEEIKRQMTQEINRAKIRAGARIHLRLGYGNDASIMPLAFNGVIADVREGPVVQVIAQGDGIELTNPILDVDDDDFSDTVMFRENLTGTLTEDTGGQTPKVILDTLLTQRGGWLAKQFKDSRFSRFFNQNPYGLFHFGDRDFKDIIPDGEPTQNIYEVDVNPSFGFIASKTTTETTVEKVSKEVKATSEKTTQKIVTSTKTTEKTTQGGTKTTTTTTTTPTDTEYSPEEEYDKTHGIFDAVYSMFSGDDDADSQGPPLISFYIANKTIWDIMHLVRSTSPQFITSVVPFNFRSSVFLGRPHYYYAYDYKQANGGLVEKRKPFQQWHVYFDMADIINNQISTSQDKIKTVATGLFKRKTPFLENCKVGPLYVDYSIYPENQRSILYDTQYVARFQDANRGYPGVKSKESAKSGGFLNEIGKYFQNFIPNTLENIGYIFKEVVPENWINDRPHKTAWNMTASKLKDCMHEMYQGQLLVMGDPSVKPYDRIILTDGYRDMNGQVLCRDVTHMFSVQTGFTTAITPDAINAIDDRDEFIRQAMSSKVIYTILRVLMTSTMTIGLIRLGAKYGDGMTRKCFQALKDSMSKASTKAKVEFGKKAQEAAEAAKEAITDTTKLSEVKSKATGVKNTLKTIAAFGRAIATGKNVASGAKALLSLSGGLVTIAGTVLVYTFGTCIDNALTNYIQNLRVTKVFPLKRYGRPYIAGLDGQHALVAGSPTENQEDTLGKVIGIIFAPGKGTTNIDSSDLGVNIPNMLRSLFFSEDLMNAAQRYTHESGLTDVDGNPIQTEEDFMNLQNSKYFGNMNFKMASSNLASVPRCAVTDGGAVQKYSAPFHATSQSITTDPAIGKMQIIVEHIGLKQYVDNKFLRLIHYGQTYSDISRVKEYTLKNKGKNLTVYGIVDDNGLIDLPILHEDTCSVLLNIVQQAYMVATAGAGSNQSDSTQAKKDMDSQFISLKKAYTVGDSSPYVSSGFSFVLEPHGSPLTEKFKSILDDLQTEVNKKSETTGQQTDVMKYQVNNSEYAVIVTIPKKG